MKLKNRNLIDRFMREGETGWKPSKKEHTDKTKYNRKEFKKQLKQEKDGKQRI